MFLCAFYRRIQNPFQTKFKAILSLITLSFGLFTANLVSLGLDLLCVLGKYKSLVLKPKANTTAVSQCETNICRLSWKMFSSENHDVYEESLTGTLL